MGLNANQVQLDKLLQEGMVLGKSVIDALPACRPEIQAKEQEMRAWVEGKVLQLTDQRISLFDRTILEILIADVVPQVVMTTNGNLLFKKQDIPVFDGHRWNYLTFSKIWCEFPAAAGYLKTRLSQGGRSRP